MKLSTLKPGAFFACCIAITGCSQATDFTHAQYVPTANVADDRVQKLLSYQVLYSFGDFPDGRYPGASLIDVKGTLYGTTSDGGANRYYGTVFSVTSGGTEKVLYSFGKEPDGDGPVAGLIDVDSTLYGTTLRGGANLKSGTVFSVTTDGVEKVLHSFGKAREDGQYPHAGLIDVGGTLYGTTAKGGASAVCNSGCGTVFSITTGGKMKLLHSFGGGSDGASPEAGLIDVNGTLYGTTREGGTYNGGTVFSITIGGTENVLHSFGSGSDGASPDAGLIDVDGTLYGTTTYGGTHARCVSGCGTVFSITRSGSEKVLHSFDDTDGSLPHAGLIAVNGTLYGTTSSGGKYEQGTVFSAGKGGTERVLHSFGGSSDGRTPFASLIDVKGTLYGTTSNGGRHLRGTVFALSP
jgi:uncharacterized repeat protein (TIGR03803 family)